MQPVPNLSIAVLDRAGRFARHWSLWFQKLSQAPPGVASVVVSASPFDYTPNNVGTVFITGGTVSLVQLIRGTDIINVGTLRAIMLSIGDTIRVTYSVLPTIKFVEL